MQAYTVSSPVTTDNESCFNSSCLCCNTSDADCPQCTFSEAAVFFAAVVVIVNFGHTQDCVERRRVYAQDELNIRANAPSPLLPQSSVQNRGEGERIFSGVVQSRRTVYAARVGGSTFICKTCIHMMHCTEVLQTTQLQFSTVPSEKNKTAFK